MRNADNDGNNGELMLLQ